MRTLWRRTNTPVVYLSSAPSKDALPGVVFNVAMLNLRVRVYVMVHKTLVPTKKLVSDRNEYNTCGLASGAHLAYGMLLLTPTQMNMDDMHNKQPPPPPCFATSTQIQ